MCLGATGVAAAIVGLLATSAAALQLNRFRLVVTGDFPVNDVAEALDLDARRDAGALLDG